MSSKLLNFQDKYYKYGEGGLETKGLVLRGYESDFLEYLVDPYPFELTKNTFKEVLWRVIYRDNGFLLFKGESSILDVRIWRDKYQDKVEKLWETITYNSLVRLGTQVDAH